MRTGPRVAAGGEVGEEAGRFLGSQAAVHGDGAAAGEGGGENVFHPRDALGAAGSDRLPQSPRACRGGLRRAPGRPSRPRQSAGAAETTKSRPASWDTEKPAEERTGSARARASASSGAASNVTGVRSACEASPWPSSRSRIRSKRTLSWATCWSTRTSPSAPSATRYDSRYCPRRRSAPAGEATAAAAGAVPRAGRRRRREGGRRRAAPQTERRGERGGSLWRIAPSAGPFGDAREDQGRKRRGRLPLHQRVPEPPVDERVDRSRVEEADLGLLRVDIRVDLIGRARHVEDPRRLTLAEERLLGRLARRVRDRPVARRPPVHVEPLERPRRERRLRRRDGPGEPHSAMRPGDRAGPAAASLGPSPR